MEREQTNGRTACRLLIVAAGLFGATGVALGAVAAHRLQSPALAQASTLLIVHAAAAVGLAAHCSQSPRPRASIAAGALLLAGTTLFAADIALRGFTGDRLFPMAAPIGGSAMIAGWLAIAIAGILELRSAKK